MRFRPRRDTPIEFGGRSQVSIDERAALLDAGLALADRSALPLVSIDQIVAEASVAKGTFYVHFPDCATFLVALHDRFHERLRDRMRVAVAGMAPGTVRLQAAIAAYLDGCLISGGVKGDAGIESG